CVAEPRRPFAPAHAGREPLDTGVEEAVSVEDRIQAFDGWIGIALTRLPTTERSARKRHHGSSARRPEHVASRHLHRMPPGFVGHDRNDRGRFDSYHTRKPDGPCCSHCPPPARDGCSALTSTGTVRLWRASATSSCSSSSKFASLRREVLRSR